MKFDYPLRPYQEESKRIWREYQEAGRLRGVISQPTGCGKCIAPDSLVWSHGLKRFDQAKDIIATHDGANKIIGWYDDGVNEGRVVSLECGLKIDGTLNHPIWVRNIDGFEGWRRIADIKSGDYAAVVRGGAHFGASDLSEPDAYALGLLVADGCTFIAGNSQRLQIDKQHRCLESIRDIIANWSMESGGTGRTVIRNKSPRHSFISARSKNIVSFLEDRFGYKTAFSENRGVPEVVKSSTENNVIAFLRGYFDGDGYCASGAVGASTASSILCDEVHALLLGVGVYAGRRLKKTVGLDAHILTIRDIDAFKKIGFSDYGEKKDTAFRKLIDNTRNTNVDTIPGVGAILRSLAARIPSKWKRNDAWTLVDAYYNGKKMPSYNMLDNWLKGAPDCEEKTSLALIRRRHFIWSKIETVKPSFVRRIDCEVDKIHAFIANGMVNHNTITGLAIAADSGRTLWIAQREELIYQPQEEAIATIDGVETGIVKAELDQVGARDIVFASIQTICRDNRLERLLHTEKENPFKLVVVDEAHHAASESHLKVLKSFEEIPVLGLTATPERHDKKGLAAIWGPKPIFHLPLIQAIDDGWLVPYVSKRMVCEKLQLDNLRIDPNSGDYDLDDLEKEIIRADVARTVAECVRNELADNPARKGIVFTVSVDQARRTSECLQELGVVSSWLCGADGRDKRSINLNALKAGSIRIICNADLLSEGYNDRSINLIVMAKPTKSKPAYIQRAGRGLRTDPKTNKEDLLILDLVGTHEAHGLITADNLAEDAKPVVARKKRERQDRNLGSARDGEFGFVKSFIDSTKRGVSGVTKRGKARSKWLPVIPDRVMALTAGEHGSLVIVREPGDSELWMGFRIPKDAWGFDEARRIMKRPAPMDFSVGVVEDRARKLGVFGLSNASAKWRESEPTDTQIAIFGRLMPNENLPLTRGEASDTITMYQLRQIFVTN